MSFVGEPLTAQEYAEALDKVDKKDSTDGFVIHHNNLGWVGVYITTPKGSKYIAYRPDIFGDAYRLCHRRDGGIGWSQVGSDVVKVLFEDLDAVKKYLKEEEL